MLPLPLWALRRRLRSCPAIQSVSYEATDERLRPVVRMAVQAFVRSAARSAFAAAALTAGIAFAGSKTYSGTLDDPGNTALIGSGPAPSAPDFTDEDAIANNVALYAFAVATAQTVEFRSLGFGEGGVDPYFTLFAGSDGTATVVGSNVDQAFSTGGDFDLTFTLASGAYQFALGAFANESFAENGGGTLADGFIGLGETYSLGDGHYRIEVTTSSTTPPSSMPEPATIALWSVAIAAACLARRASHPRRRSRLFPGARETRTMNRAKPSAVVGTRNAVIPAAFPSSPPVRAKTRSSSETSTTELKRFSPVMIQSSPS